MGNYVIIFFVLFLSIGMYACPTDTNTPPKDKYINTPSKPTNNQPNSPYAKFTEYSTTNSEDGTYKVSKGKQVLGTVNVENKGIDKTFTLLGSPTSIPKDAFFDKKFTAINIEGARKIEGWAFSFNEIVELVIPESVSYIGVKAFMQNKIRALTIPESVRYIGDAAFMDNALEVLVIPKSINKKANIGTKAFTGNTKVTKVSLSKTLYNGLSKSELQNRFGHKAAYKDLDGNNLPTNKP